MFTAAFLGSPETRTHVGVNPYKMTHTVPCRVAVILVEFKAQGVRIGNMYIMKPQPEFLFR